MPFTELELRQALMQTGSMLPMNTKAVEELERMSPTDELPLPPSLSCDRILERIRTPRAIAVLKFPSAISIAPASEGLARAARNGEELPDEIIAQMQADRERVEGQGQA